MKTNHLLLLLSFYLFSCTSPHNPKHQQLNQHADPSIPEITEVMVKNDTPEIVGATDTLIRKNVHVSQPNPLDFIPIECIMDLVIDDICKAKGESIFCPPGQNKP